MAVQGTWTNPLTGKKITDYGVTEKIANALGYKGSTQNTATYNTAAAQKGQIGSPVYAQIPMSMQTGTPSGSQSKAIQSPAPSTDTLQRAASGSGSGSGTGSNPVNAFSEPTAPGYEGPSDEDINAMYDPVFKSYNETEASIRGMEPGYLENIKQSGETQKIPIDTRLTEGTKELGTQEQQTRDAEKSAIAQARKLFNELSQYNLARFGSGSSAGQATMELLGRTTSGAIGQASDTAQKNVATIKDNLLKLGNFVTEQKAKIDSDVNTKTLQAKQWFMDKLNEINSNRAMLEADKAAKRYQLLGERSAYINNLNTAKYNYQNELYAWQTKRQTELGDLLKSSSEANPEAVGTGDFGDITENMVSTAPYIQGENGTTYAPNEQGVYAKSGNIIKRWNPDTNKEEYYNKGTGQFLNSTILGSLDSN